MPSSGHYSSYFRNLRLSDTTSLSCNQYRFLSLLSTFSVHVLLWSIHHSFDYNAFLLSRGRGDICLMCQSWTTVPDRQNICITLLLWNWRLQLSKRTIIPIKPAHGTQQYFDWDGAKGHPQSLQKWSCFQNKNLELCDEREQKLHGSSCTFWHIII